LKSRFSGSGRSTSSRISSLRDAISPRAAIYFDSSALTAGTVQAADKELRGATMGLHSMCGYAGGFMGPLGVGLVLDLVGSSQGWGVAFGHLALITLTGLFFLRRLGARSALQTLAATSG
jgi:MFS family permease